MKNKFFSISQGESLKALLHLKVRASAKQDVLIGCSSDERRLILHIKEHAHHGRANAFVEKFFQKIFLLPTEHITIIRGEKSPLKVLLITFPSHQKLEFFLSWTQKLSQGST